jgi:hypothetical protein
MGFLPGKFVVGRFVDRDFLADGGRGQVDDQAFAGIRQVGVFDGGMHSFTRFFNGGVGQPPDIYAWQTVGRGYLDFDHNPFKALTTHDQSSAVAIATSGFICRPSWYASS